MGDAQDGTRRWHQTVPADLHEALQREFSGSSDSDRARKAIEAGIRARQRESDVVQIEVTGVEEETLRELVEQLAVDQ